MPKVIEKLAELILDFAEANKTEPRKVPRDLFLKQVKTTKDLTFSTIKKNWTAAKTVAIQRNLAATVKNRKPSYRTELINEHKDKLQIRDLRRDKRELLAHIVELEDRLDKYLAVKNGTKAQPVQYAGPRNAGKRVGTPVLLLSDLHVEEKVDPTSVNNLNEYNPEIAERRFVKVIEGCRNQINDLSENQYDMDTLVMWLGGDLISGYIHDELKECNAMAPIEAILWIQARIRWAIKFLLKETDIKKIVIPCSFGNHGRTTQKKNINKPAENNFEWMMYKNLEAHYEGRNDVEFIVGNSICTYLDVHNTTIRFTHGDAVKFGGGLGGITGPINKALNAWNKDIPADITCMGHFHTYMSLQDLVVNGSLIGHTPFSLSIKATQQQPMQSFFIIDEERGKTLSTPLWCTDV